MSHALLLALAQSQQARPNLEKAIYEYFYQFADGLGNIDHEVDLTIGTRLTTEDDGQEYQYIRATSYGLVDAPCYEDTVGWDSTYETTTSYKDASTAMLEFVAQKILDKS